MILRCLGLRVVAKERLLEIFEVECQVGAVLWWFWRINLYLWSDVSDYRPHVFVLTLLINL